MNNDVLTLIDKKAKQLKIQDTIKPELILTESVADKIHKFIGLHPAERGGMIGRDSDGVIRHFVADVTARTDKAAYDPDIETMNMVIKNWKTQNIEFCGFVHSHPKYYNRPSPYDIWYCGEILSCFKKLEYIWVPIILTEPDTGKYIFNSFAAVPDKDDRKNCRIVQCRMKIENEKKNFTTKSSVEKISYDTQANLIPVEDITESDKAKNSEERSTIEKAVYWGKQKTVWTPELFTKSGPLTLSNIEASRFNKINNDAADRYNQYFERLKKDYDLNLLNRTRLIIIGTGGAASMIKNCARTGISEFILIDPDVVSATNVATQDATSAKINTPKVYSLAEDILKINPAAAVLTFNEKIEAIDDELFAKLIKSPLRWQPNKAVNDSKNQSSYSSNLCSRLMPRKTILMVLTDNFYANARGHRLGLNFELPTICAQEYISGIGAEVTYTVPGVTKSCHRCMTASRYNAYLNNGYKNNVTSEGAPIFAAEYLNAVLGHVLLAVIFHETFNRRWKDRINEWGDRNLILMKIDSDFDAINHGLSVRLKGVEDPLAFPMFNTVFCPQTPDSGQSPSRPVCPDCGGTGRLESLKGTFKDTRVMR